MSSGREQTRNSGRGEPSKNSGREATMNSREPSSRIRTQPTYLEDYDRGTDNFREVDMLKHLTK